MQKLDLNEAADEFEMISDEHQFFYNIETGEFDFYIDPIYSGMEDDYEKFVDDAWIAAPNQRDLHEENSIPYIGAAEKPKQESSLASEREYPEEVIVIPLVKIIAEESAEVMRDALGYNKHDATNEVKRIR